MVVPAAAGEQTPKDDMTATATARTMTLVTSSTPPAPGTPMIQPPSEAMPFWLMLATNAEEWAALRRTLPHLDPEPPDLLGAVKAGLEGSDGLRHYAVWLNLDGGRIKLIELVEVCAHEAAHVAARHLEHIGTRTTAEDSEALAETVGWCTAWLWRAAMIRMHQLGATR